MQCTKMAYVWAWFSDVKKIKNNSFTKVESEHFFEFDTCITVNSLD